MHTRLAGLGDQRQIRPAEDRFVREWQAPRELTDAPRLKDCNRGECLAGACSQRGPPFGSLSWRSAVLSHTLHPTRICCPTKGDEILPPLSLDEPHPGLLGIDFPNHRVGVAQRAKVGRVDHNEDAQTRG